MLAIAPPGRLPFRYRLDAARTLTNGTSVQSIFNVGCTVPIGIYRIQMFVMLSTGTSSHDVDLGMGGTATWTATDFTHRTRGLRLAANANSTTPNLRWNDTLTNGTGQATGISGSTIASKLIEFMGTVKLSAGGTLIPQLKFSAAPGGTNTVKLGSWVTIEPFANSGPWA